MKWGKSIADERCIGPLRWTVAWWLENEVNHPFVFPNGYEAFIVKLRGKKGYFLVSYPLAGEYETVEYGPFPTLRLAKTTYLLATRSPE